MVGIAAKTLVSKTNYNTLGAMFNLTHPLKYSQVCLFVCEQVSLCVCACVRGCMYGCVYEWVGHSADGECCDIASCLLSHGHLITVHELLIMTTDTSSDQDKKFCVCLLLYLE